MKFLLLLLLVATVMLLTGTHQHKPITYYVPEQTLLDILNLQPPTDNVVGSPQKDPA